MARPTKIDMDRVLMLFSALAEGQTIASAARSAGVGAATAYRWRARGRAGDPNYTAVARVFDAAETSRRHTAFVRFAGLPLLRTLMRHGL